MTRSSMIFGIVCLVFLIFYVASPSFGEAIPENVLEALDLKSEILGRFSVVHEYIPTPEDKARPREEFSRVITKVSYAHGGGDVHIWCIEFAGEAPLNYEWNVVFYIDADNDISTGRAGLGAEEQIGIKSVGGTLDISRRSYAANGQSAESPAPLPLRTLVHGRRLYIRYDNLTKNVEGDELLFRCSILSEGTIIKENKRATINKKEWGPVRGIKAEEAYYITGRPSKKLQKTYGLDLIRDVVADSKNHVMPVMDCEVENFRLYPYSHETFSLYSPAGGRITADVGTSGKFYPGFVIYDESGVHEYILTHNGTEIGRGVGDEENNREWLLFSQEPIEVKKGDTLSIQALGSSNDKIYYILLMEEKPELREEGFSIDDVRWVLQDELLILSCTTPRPADVELYVEVAKVLKTTGISVCHRFEIRDFDSQKLQIGLKASDGFGKEVTENLEIDLRSTRGWGVEDSEVPLYVHLSEETKDLKVSWPVAVGVPLPQGEMPDVSKVKVQDKDGREVPAQFQPLSWWEDGTVKWLLVQFNIEDISQAEEYGLVYGSQVTPGEYRDMLLEDRGQALVLTHDEYTLLLPKSGSTLAKIEGSDVYTLYGSMSMEGLEYFCSGERTISIEENGPVRTVLRINGRLMDDKGRQTFDYEIRLFAYADLPALQISTALINTNNQEFSMVDSWALKIEPESSVEEVCMGLGDKVLKARSAGLTHIYHNYYQLEADNKVTENKDTAQGWARVSTGQGQLGVAVKYFSEKYPKQLKVTRDSLLIGLAPEIDSQWYNEYGGDYEKHGLHFYLHEGGHKLRRGMSFFDEMLLLFSEESLPIGDMAQVFKTPPVLRCSAQWYNDSEVMRTHGGFAIPEHRVLPEYEEIIDSKVAGYRAIRQSDRAYGSLNFGDWYGERGVNWGNNEYDLAYGMYIQYLRSGDVGAFYTAKDMANHYMNIDIRHSRTDDFHAWAVFEHSIGHTGGYYSTSPFSSGEGITSPYPVHQGHWVMEGLVMNYYLTGDRRSLDIARKATYRWDREVLYTPYDWFTETRKPGWFLINNMALYEATQDPYFLNAATLMVRRVLERQSTEGGWPRLLHGGHCSCEIPCIGNAAFCVGVLIDGLHMYYAVTQSEEVRDAIINASRFLVKDLWDEKSGFFKYTSCKTMAYTGSGTFQSTIAYGAKLSHDIKLLEASYMSLEKVMEGASASGKSLSTLMLRFPHLLHTVEENRQIDTLLEELKTQKMRARSKQFMGLGALGFLLIFFFILSAREQSKGAK
jgi:hypothetical protein